MKFFAKVFEEIRMMYTVHLRIAGVMFFIPGGLFYRNTLTDVPIIVCNLQTAPHRFLYNSAMMLLLGGIFFVLAFIGVRRYVGTANARV